jgi:Putative transposase/Transposase zinc-binding domain
MNDRNLLKEILVATRQVWDRPGTRSSVRENFAAVIDCGTPVLGWKEYASENERRRCFHRCKSRFCPSCGYRATLLWLEQQDAALPDVPYSGVVFTMPRALWSIFKRNRHLLHDLPVLGAEVIKQWVKMKYGATPAIVVVPHTFGGDLKFNTHLHLLVSDGAFQEGSGCWVPDLRLFKRAVMRMWRFAVVHHLRLAHAAGILNSNLNCQDFKRLLSDAYQTSERDYWIIHIDRIVSKTHFLNYAARYVRRPPIAKWRILEVADGVVEYVAKDTKGGVLTPARCTLEHFVRLLAPHVPDKYRHAIRYFGILAPRTRGQMYAALFLSLGQEQRPRPQRLSWRDALLKYFRVDPMIDSFGQEMHWVR